MALVLNKSNQVFKFHYDEILKVIYPKNLMMVFWDEIRNKPLNIPETFDNDINGLLKVCLDYSKLSRNKI
ncbi:hypothetical protein Belba_2863 [Belliella baltica DSM 15883]|uniref:Uncharacterized protein n=1 Tax=Belliella baltica (strain DSM 15883 / CIP 108006 / LMG 21964 / BA134) TaxID=866536 RepID=I3Z827_BELBD|nr:hypothetical protein Belba_2863 [Belliella baltica DSM 15883]